MDARKLSASVAAVLIAMMTAIPTAANASGTTTRWVDGDGRAGAGGCGASTRAYRSIQSAVDASNANDRVVVCPGTYAQQVRITGHRDGLTLVSSTPYGATITQPASPTHTDGATLLVKVDHVNGVLVRGFRSV